LRGVSLASEERVVSSPWYGERAVLI